MTEEKWLQYCWCRDFEYAQFKELSGSQITEEGYKKYCVIRTAEMNKFFEGVSQEDIDAIGEYLFGEQNDTH